MKTNKGMSSSKWWFRYTRSARTQPPAPEEETERSKVSRLIKKGNTSENKDSKFHKKGIRAKQGFKVP